MATAFESLMVEIGGNSDKLKAAVAESKGALRSVATEAATVTKQTVATGEAATGMGNRYALAARNIAGAGLQIASTGRVSSESIKGLITQAGMLATAFGTGGIVVGAIGIATVALVNMYGRAKEEHKKFLAEIAEMQNAGDVDGMMSAARKIQSGQPGDGSNPRTGLAPGSIDDLRAELKLLEQEKLVAREKNLTHWRELDEREREISAKLTAAEARMNALKAAVMGPGPNTGPQGMLPVGIVAKSPEALAKERADAAKKAADAAAKAAEEYVKQVEKEWELRGKIAAVVQKTVDTLADAATDPLVAELEKIISFQIKIGDIAGAMRTKDMKDQYEQQLRINKGVEDYKKKVADAEAAGKAVLDVQEKQEAAIKAAKDAQKKAADEALRDAQARANAIRQAIDGVTQIAEAFGLVDEKTAKIFQNLGQVASSIDPLLKALKAGSTGDAIAAGLSIAGGIASIASSVFGGPSDEEKRRNLQAHIDEWNKTLDDWIDGIRERGGQFAAAVGEAREQQKANNDALQKEIDQLTAMRRVAREQGFDESADRMTTQIDALTEVMEKNNAITKEAIALAEIQRKQREAEYVEDLRVQTLRAKGQNEAADALSLELEYQDRLNEAKREGFGPAAFAAIEEWHAAMVAAAQAAHEAAEAEKARRDALSRQQTEEDLFDITDPAEIIRRRVRLYQDLFGDLFDGILDGIDLDTQEGLDEFTRRIQRLFESLTPEKLAELGITPEMFDAIIDALLGLEHAADEVAAGIADTVNEIMVALDGTGQPTFGRGRPNRGGRGTDAAKVERDSGGGSRTETVIGGRISIVGEDRMVALLTTANAQRADIRAILARANGLGPTLPPNIPAGMTFGAGSTVNQHFTFTITQNIGADAARSPQLTRQATDALVREIMRRIAQADRQQQQFDGRSP